MPVRTRFVTNHNSVGFFSFYTSLCSLSFVHVQDRHSMTDTCPINPYSEWLGVVVKAGEYGSVRCRVLNGSKGSFPWSLNYPGCPSLLTQIFLDFFQTVSVPFLSFLPGGPRTCQGLIRPRLCPRTILYLYYLSWAITLLGLGLGPQ